MKKHKVQWLLLFLFDQFGFIDVKILQPFERMGFPWLRRSKQQITRLKLAAVVIRKAPLLIMPYFLLVEKKHANNQQTIKSRTVKCRSLEGGRPIKKKTPRKWLYRKSEGRKKNVALPLSFFPSLFFFPISWQRQKNEWTYAGRAVAPTMKKSNKSYGSGELKVAAVGHSECVSRTVNLFIGRACGLISRWNSLPAAAA